MTFSDRSKLGYRSLLLTGSMVGGLGVFGHDDAVGFAGEEEQGGRTEFKARKVNDKVRKARWVSGWACRVLRRVTPVMLGSAPCCLRRRRSVCASCG